MSANEKPQSIDFLGRGISMPFNVSGEYHSGKTEIKESVEYAIQTLNLIFNTRKYSRPMRRRQGISLNSVIFRPILSSLRSQVEYYINEALKSFNEKRFSILKVEIDFKKSKGSSIYFVITAKNISNDKIFTVPYLWEYIR